MAIVTLTTDFGNKDPYVAEVKGVLLSQLPSLQIVDITHEVTPFSVVEGAFQLLRAYHRFPESACHLAVVDPGVGSGRKCLFVKTGYGIFVGPDNGILRWAVEDAVRRKKKKAVVYEIPVPPKIIPTFHARDVMAPVIAGYLRGRKLRLKRLDEFKGSSLPAPMKISHGMRGSILHCDHYGNCVTNISLGLLSPGYGELHRSKLKVVTCYEDIPNGEIALVRGSHGFWEVAAKSDSAKSRLKIQVGDSITLFE